jgi:DNA invertase Pin-like site-specific DNA recombinase
MDLLLAARVSTGKGQTGIQTQDQHSREWAEREGHTIIAVAADRRSGTVAPWDRPNLKPWVTQPELLAAYDGILAYKNDRLSRGDWADEARIRQWAQDNGKVLMIADGPQWPPRHDGDKWAWEAMANQARQEWEAIRERIVRAQRYLRANGYLVGKPPFGCRVACAERCGQGGSECKHHKTLEPDPRLVPYVTEVARRYIAGASLTAMCEYLESGGISSPGGGAWQQYSLRRALENPALIGRRKNANGQTILRFPPVLEMDLWTSLQARLKTTREAPARGAVSTASALLAGIIYCAWCGRKMHFKRPYNTHKDGTRVYRNVYRCDGTIREWSTCRNMISAKEADEWITSWVTEVIGNHELVTRVVVPGHGYDGEIAEVESEIRALDLDDPDYLHKVAALRAERTRLQGLPAVPAEVIERSAGITIGQHWAGLDTADRRAWLLADQVKVMAYRPPIYGGIPIGAPPFTFTVEALIGEWRVQPLL